MLLHVHDHLHNRSRYRALGGHHRDTCCLRRHCDTLLNEQMIGESKLHFRKYHELPSKNLSLTLRYSSKLDFWICVFAVNYEPSK